jgi:hypothetical protein
MLEAIDNLLVKSAKSISESRQSELVLSSLEFPLSSEIGMNAFFRLEPIKSIWTSSPIRPINDQRWKSSIKQLILAVEKDVFSRKEAILRLAYLSNYNLLTDDEKSCFASALWSKIDHEGQNLPINTGMILSRVLARLPCPPSIDVKSLIDKHIFNIDILKLAALPENLDTQVMHEKMILLASILDTKILGLSLSQNQAVSFFDQIVQWEPFNVSNSDPISISLISNFQKGIMQLFGEILSQLVLPAMGSVARTESRGRTLFDFVYFTKSWYCLPALPYFILANPALNKDIKMALRRGLVGKDLQLIDSAAIAILNWGKLVKMKILNELPQDITDLLVATIEIRHEIGLPALLKTTLFLLEEGFLKKKHKLQLMQSLADLRIETRYEGIPLDTYNSISVPLIRVECVKLARVLKKYIKDDGTLQAWSDDAKHDPLPEVRFSR